MTAPDLLELLALPSLLLLGSVAWLVHLLRRQHRATARLVQARQEEATARMRAAARAAWLDAALEALEEGILIADRDQRAVHWNTRFAALAGLPDDMPREGATLASLLHLSAEAGEFGLVDIQQEVANQLALVARGPAAFPQLRHRPDGAIVEVRLLPLPGGGLMLRSADVTARHRPPPAGSPSAPPLPAPSPPAAPIPPNRPPQATTATIRPRRCLVLLVEDMKVNQVVTATQLRREGHRVDIAASGADALAMAARTPYDVVLMDLMMPGMSGYDTARRLRALPGPAGRVPIHALTANTGEDDRARCLEAGMQGMLSKPVSAAALRDLLQHGTARNAPPPHLEAAGLLDAGRLAELRRDLPAATLSSLCRQCLEDMEERLHALGRAVAHGAPADMEREAHALAGMAGSYGLAAVERQARAVLSAARRQEGTAARSAAAPLPDSFARSRAALLAWLSPA
jgi:CheY-like chemotaxis protein/PAS domain-containing protein/HPt (histidine-containing phosphotransfer) domain-containing protein